MERERGTVGSGSWRPAFEGRGAGARLLGFKPCPSDWLTGCKHVDFGLWSEWAETSGWSKLNFTYTASKETVEHRNQVGCLLWLWVSFIICLVNEKVVQIPCHDSMPLLLIYLRWILHLLWEEQKEKKKRMTVWQCSYFYFDAVSGKRKANLVSVWQMAFREMKWQWHYETIKLNNIYSMRSRPWVQEMFILYFYLSAPITSVNDNSLCISEHSRQNTNLAFLNTAETVECAQF